MSADGTGSGAVTPAATSVRSVSADVLVVGAGLAGLHTATRLARLGHDVLLVDRRACLTSAIRTTGIFVHRTFADFALPAGCLGPAIRHVVLYPPSLERPVTLTSGRDEFRVGDMARLYAAVGAEAERAGVRLRLGTRYAGHEAGRYRIVGPDGPLLVRARFVVGADGARSSVARDLDLDRNRHVLVGAEEVYPVEATSGPPTFHCVLDPRIAPGYLAWVVDDGQHVHVGTAGYLARYPRGMRGALREFAATAPGLSGTARLGEVERRGGPIPVGGLLRRISCRDGLLVGDAAGAVSPLTAGGLDPCLRLSDHAAQVLDEALRADDPQILRHFDGRALRRRFQGRLVMRSAMAQLRSPALVEGAFGLLRTSAGQQAARRVLFGDGSFPLPRPIEQSTSS